MVFWRKKKNAAQYEQEERDERLVHPKGEPAIEPSTDYEPEIDEALLDELEESDMDILEDLDVMPLPNRTMRGDVREAEALRDHSEDDGWLSRLTKGLGKSSNKITKGLGDLLTKKKLDQEMLDSLEEVLIEADLGPKTAASVVEAFSKDRFGKDVSEEEVRGALAETIAHILEPVAGALAIEKPANGPFVLLVCGVNGAGKTTTIGKLAYTLARAEHKKVMIAAGDTFRAAAIEQLEVWAKRAGASFMAKDVGADAASVAFEAYEKAKADGVDVLLIDTAGRLQNKANLMEELAKIVRVLKKQDENLPHQTVLVLDATTGQNAFSQVETFKDMVDVNGLVVTKLDGSAKGGVLVGLADQFGLPVYAVGIGEAAEDMQPFHPAEYARALMGVEGE